MFVNAGILAAGVGGTPPGQRTFTLSQSFVVPDGVTSICAVAVARGENATDFGEGTYRSGEGGNLRYVNDIPVTPGETLQVEVQFGYYPGLLRGSTYLLRAYIGAGSVGLGFDGGGYQQSNALNMAGAGAGGYTSAGQSASAAGSTPRGGSGTSLLGGGPGGLAGAAPDGTGGAYGGGGAVVDGVPQQGGPAGLRIIWGAGRAFPNTNTGDV